MKYYVKHDGYRWIEVQVVSQSGGILVYAFENRTYTAFPGTWLYQPESPR